MVKCWRAGVPLPATLNRVFRSGHRTLPRPSEPCLGSDVYLVTAAASTSAGDQVAAGYHCLNTHGSLVGILLSVR